MSVEEKVTTLPASQTLTPCERREICATLIDANIQSGFASELHMSEAEYDRSFKQAVEDVMRAPFRPNGQLIALVETRIPFVRQLELRGIDLDPAIFYGVELPKKDPYAVFLKVISTKEAPFAQGANYAEAVQSLPGDLRPASPLEGINADVQKILAQSFVILPGGEYKMPPNILTSGSRSRSLCLERYFDRPRISQISFAEQDLSVGMLAARN